MAGLCPIVIGFRRSPFQLIQSRRKCGCYIQGAYGGRITVVFFYYCVARLYHCGDIGCACCVSNRIVNEITAIEHEGFDPLYTTL